MSAHDMRDEPPYPPIDLVLVRWVLIGLLAFWGAVAAVVWGVVA